MSFPENKLTVRSPADLVAAVPYLLGFHLFRTTMAVDLGGSGMGNVVVKAARPTRDRVGRWAAP